jgi:integrase
MIPRISFYLKNNNAQKFSVLFSNIRYSGYAVKVYLPFKVNPKLWDKKKQIVKEKTLPYYDETLDSIDTINSGLKRYSQTVCEYIDQYSQTNYNAPPTPDLLKSHINSFFRNREHKLQVPYNLFTFFQKIIDDTRNGIRTTPKGKIISEGTATTYELVKKVLEDYKNQSPFHIDFETIDLRFYEDFKKYLFRKQFSNNTIGKYFKVLKTILRAAKDHNIQVNDFLDSNKFQVISEDAENIYLTETELDKIKNLNFDKTKRLDEVRDLFLVGCYTGLRFSNFTAIKTENFTSDGFIEVKQSKSDNKVVIPIKNELRQILEKYQYKLPKAISNQKFNEYIKEIGQMLPELQTEIEVKTTKGGQVKKETFKKYELISTHTARRSFATNEYLNETSIIAIMSITGHKTEKSFLKYIKLSNRDHAKQIQKQWEKK